MTSLEVCPARTADQRAAAAVRAAGVLERGGLLIYPTETVYGLGGDGSDATNAAIGRLKDWDGPRPLIWLVPSVDALVGRVEWPGPADRLAERFWPGPLTLIVPARECAAGLIGPDGGVAVRVSPDPVVEAILAEWGGGLTSTSANRTGRPPARTLAAALTRLGGPARLTELDRPVLGLDAGAGGAEPSTIVSLLEGTARLVREGPIGRSELAEVLPELNES